VAAASARPTGVEQQAWDYKLAQRQASFGMKAAEDCRTPRPAGVSESPRDLRVSVMECGSAVPLFSRSTLTNPR
jgi:hypothetical protein